MSRTFHLLCMILAAVGLTALFLIVLPAQQRPLASPQAAITVNTLEDEDNDDGDCSLREAIRAANNNLPVDACPAGGGIPDSITFVVTGTIILNDQLTVTASDPLEIDGAGDVTLSGGGSVRIFYVDAAAALKLVSLTLVNGSAGAGGAILNQGALIIINSILSGNRATYDFTGYGGAILNGYSGILTITNSTLSNNSAVERGGAIHASYGSVSLSDSTLIGNSAEYGGGIYTGNGSLTIINSSLSNNHANSSGGGIENGHSLTITNSTLSGNSADVNGGGISNGGMANINDSTFFGNSAVYDGGSIANGGGTMSINQSTFSGNNAGSGGGIYNNEYASLTLATSIVSGNSARYYGGGIFNIDTMSISDSTLTDNTAGSGGGIYNFERSSLTVITSVLSGNRADYGGGIYNLEKLSIRNSTLSGNQAYQDGGGIYNGTSIYNYPTSELDITDSTLSANSAYYAGGGIYNYNLLTITTSTLSDNTAHIGGGIFNRIDATTTLTNTTLSGNRVGFRGGGIDNSGIFNITHITLSGNSAEVEGGGIYNYPGYGEAVFSNSIIAYGPSGTNCAGDPITDAGINIEDNDTCGFDPANGSMPNTDPLLGPLQDNGGPTWTHALLHNSPAIDAGDPISCPPSDQRGVARPVDGDGDGTAVCDIGAVEFELIWGVYLPILAGTN